MTESTQKQPVGRRLRVVLFVSLALNLVVVGLVAGLAFKGGPPTRGVSRSADPVMPYSRAFTEDQRKELRGALRRSFAPSDRERSGEGMAESYREAVQVLREDPFDRARLEIVINRQRALAEKRHGNGNGILGQYLDAMTPADRAAYADRLEEEVERLSKRRKRWRKD
ncbi:MAG: periplasmic heavy metal sensor [Pelagimonas sp.]|uniref:periplasmic heavy metal sensor n=1 Tax=Pelagimonas sp. TaxID=2073170 RepID=UPI003D6C0383